MSLCKHAIIAESKTAEEPSLTTSETCNKDRCPHLSEDKSAMASRIMRAIRVAQFGGPEMMKLMKDVPVPKPQERQILIKVMTVGVNPVDTYIRAGAYAMLPSLPYTPGQDVAGIVEAVGQGVTKVKRGDRVFTVRTETGAYAEYTVAKDTFTFPMHDSISFSQGAALGIPYFTAYKSLFIRGHAKPSESVLIHGASGAVGLAACQIARAYGLTVLGTAGTSSGMQLVKENGAHHVFNHREDGYTEKIMESTNGQGINLILEMLSNVNLQKDLELMSSGGRTVVIGCRGSIEINPRLTMGKESMITGVALMVSSEAEWQEMGSAIVAGMEQGYVKPIVGQEFPLEKAIEAHEEVINHSSGTKGKIILSV